MICETENGPMTNDVHKCQRCCDLPFWEDKRILRLISLYERNDLSFNRSPYT